MEEEKKEKSFTFVDKRRRSGEEEESAPARDEKPAPPEKEPAAGEEPAGGAVPPIDFPTFIVSLSSSAAYHMGGYQDPVSGKTSMNKDLARQTIDIIAMLREKTRGNLTEDEERLISNLLRDLRMKFVEVFSSGS
ncbi:MAG: DUF1844 domain-containing protein [Candidatus Nitrospinota bacterium M3_3B_026]